MTLTECWARMLLCITGLSPEKVATIIEEYETPRDLWEAFRLAEKNEGTALPADEDEGPQKKRRRRNAQGPATAPPAKYLLTTLSGSGRRHVGNAFSARVYDVLMAPGYED